MANESFQSRVIDPKSSRSDANERLLPNEAIHLGTPTSDNNHVNSECNKNRSRNEKLSDKLLQISQLKEFKFYQALISELFGTFILTLVCTSVGLPITSSQVPDLNGALASGLIVATIIVGFSHISGAHINPAVTITFLVICKIDIIRAILYICMQLIGAACASNLVVLITPSGAQRSLGMTTVTEGVSLLQALCVEVLITFILCYTVHAICDEKRNDIDGSKALAVGFAVTIGCLFGGPYTGAAMNPARAFGPALAMNAWTNHWVYWIGPIIGSIIAAIVYNYILKTS